MGGYTRGVRRERFSDDKRGESTDKSNAGGLYENIDAFENGIKVYVDPESLAWGINLMTDEPENAGTLGKRGRIKVDRLFLRDPIARGLTDTYTRTVA